MRIFMDTDAVRGMAANIRRTADDLDARVDGLLSQIENMEWQSNARTEFDGNFKGIHRNVKTIANAMRLMGSAADAKASQWEAIASKLLGPFVAVQNFWQAAIDHLGAIAAVIGGILIGGISRWIQPGRVSVHGWPSGHPPFPYPSGKPLLRFWPKLPDEIRKIQGPSWLPDRPNWLPTPGGAAGGGAGGSGGGGWGPDDSGSVGGGTAGGGGGGGGGGGAGGSGNGGGSSGGGGGGSSTGGGSDNAPIDGIPSSRTPADKLGVLGGCTNYVATKRDVSGFWKPGRMNAQYWNENAAAAGYGVGSKPVAGAIMVVEADNGIDNGIMNVNDKAGHVLYVESVKETSGGYLVSYSHAGTLYDDAGNYIPGTYKMLNNSAPVFVPYESPAVSFIYDKI
jgi:surface antigen/uncharacterized protein YukE